MWLLVFFERLGDEYVSWWYLQHMLPYGSGISLYQFMHLYSIFYLRLFLSILFYAFCNLVLKRQTKTVNGTRASPNFNCLFLYKSNTEGTNFVWRLFF